MKKNEFYTTSERAWDAMFEAISGANKYIFLEMYIFVDDIETEKFFNTLVEKAKKGVIVKIIIDSFGSRNISTETVEKMRNAGVELLFFSYWLKRTHKKILVVDGRIAFLGGVNIHKIFKKWNDLQVRLTGYIVKSVIRSFANTYKMCGGKDIDVLVYANKKTFLKKAKLWILEHKQVGKNSLIKKHYIERIGSAKGKIIIITPYFVPRRWLVAALHQAILRGAMVDVVLPQRTDLWHMNKANYFYMSQLSQLGVVFYLLKDMIHAKAMIVDDKEAVVGSQNIDPLSFDYDLETGVFFTDKNMVNDLIEIVNNWKSKSEVFDPATHKKTLTDYIINPLMRILLILL